MKYRGDLVLNSPINDLSRINMHNLRLQLPGTVTSRIPVLTVASASPGISCCLRLSHCKVLLGTDMWALDRRQDPVGGQTRQLTAPQHPPQKSGQVSQWTDTAHRQREQPRAPRAGCSRHCSGLGTVTGVWSLPMRDHDSHRWFR